MKACVTSHPSALRLELSQKWQTNVSPSFVLYPFSIHKMQQNASHDAAMKRAYSPSLVHLYSVSRGGPLFATETQIREIENSQCKVLVSLDARCAHCTSNSIFTCSACKDMFCATHLKQLLECQLRCGCQTR